MTDRPLVIGMALSPTWLRGDSWRATDSRAEELFSLSSYADIARAAERAALDFLFAPESGHLDTSVLDRSPGFSTLDSHTLLSALAALTTRIGLVPTVQTSFAAPYPVARALQSLHRISEGRAGWNVVTAIGGHENVGLDASPSSVRYAQAGEFVAAVRALWDSYPADAVLLDRESGRFADRARVRPVDLAGPRYRIAGPLSVPAHESGHPPLFQAGGSTAGIAFAGATADAVFGMAPDLDSACVQRRALRAAAESAGRVGDDVRFLPGLSFVLAGSRDEARRVAGERAIDGARHWSVVGTPEDAVEEVVRRHGAGAIDGFIALAGGSWRSIGLFLGEVVPALAARGLVRSGYTGHTLRAHLGMA